MAKCLLSSPKNTRREGGREEESLCNGEYIRYIPLDLLRQKGGRKEEEVLKPISLNKEVSPFGKGKKKKKKKRVGKGGNVCGSFISVPKQVRQQSRGLPR